MSAASGSNSGGGPSNQAGGAAPGAGGGGNNNTDPGGGAGRGADFLGASPTRGGRDTAEPVLPTGNTEATANAYTAARNILSGNRGSRRLREDEPMFHGSSYYSPEARRRHREEQEEERFRRLEQEANVEGSERDRLMRNERPGGGMSGRSRFYGGGYPTEDTGAMIMEPQVNIVIRKCPEKAEEYENWREHVISKLLNVIPLTSEENRNFYLDMNHATFEELAAEPETSHLVRMNNKMYSAIYESLQNQAGTVEYATDIRTNCTPGNGRQALKLLDGAYGLVASRIAVQAGDALSGTKIANMSELHSYVIKTRDAINRTRAIPNNVVPETMLYTLISRGIEDLQDHDLAAALAAYRRLPRLQRTGTTLLDTLEEVAIAWKEKDAKKSVKKGLVGKVTTKFQGECYHCGAKGHRASECRKKAAGLPPVNPQQQPNNLNQNQFGKGNKGKGGKKGKKGKGKGMMDGGKGFGMFAGAGPQQPVKKDMSLQCVHCGRRGHLIQDCWWAKQQNQANGWNQGQFGSGGNNPALVGTVSGAYGQAPQQYSQFPPMQPAAGGVAQYPTQHTIAGGVAQYPQYPQQQQQQQLQQPNNGAKGGGKGKKGDLSGFVSFLIGRNLVQGNPGLFPQTPQFIELDSGIGGDFKSVPFGLMAWALDSGASACIADPNFEKFDGSVLPVQGVTISAIGGYVNVPAAGTVNVSELGDQFPCMMVDQSPSVLSLGWLVEECGYSCSWSKKNGFKLFSPDGKVIPTSVIDKVPHLICNDGLQQYKSAFLSCSVSDQCDIVSHALNSLPAERVNELWSEYVEELEKKVLIGKEKKPPVQIEKEQTSDLPSAQSDKDIQPPASSSNDGPFAEPFSGE